MKKWVNITGVTFSPKALLVHFYIIIPLCKKSGPGLTLHDCLFQDSPRTVSPSPTPGSQLRDTTTVKKPNPTNGTKITNGTGSPKFPRRYVCVQSDCLIARPLPLVSSY